MKSQRFVLLGHPVRHSISAAMHTAAFRAAGLPHSYTPISVPKLDDLARMIGELRTGLLSGANITLPHKRAVLTMVDELDISAELCGAANVVMADARGRLVAYNTDVEALEAEIAQVTSARSRAVVLGAGGAAAAALVACMKLDFKVVGVTNRSWSDTEATHESESARWMRKLGGLTSPWPSEARVLPSTKFSMAMRLQWSELAVQADLVIQATSAGMMGGEAGDDLAKVVPFDKLKPSAVALDVVYRPPVTPFLAQAEAAGLTAVGGLGMLVRQAEATYRLWVGADPPKGVMKQAADVVLGLPAST